MSTGKITYDFSGDAVLITGGSSGIGLECARAFSRAGAEVTITGTRTAPTDYDEDLSAFNYRQCEMSDTTQVDSLVAAITRLDILVNNAGATVTEDPLGADAFDLTVTINLNAVYRLCHALHPKLAKRGGAIVNIASMRSYFASPGSPGYGAAKAGVLQLTKSLAALYAEDGIRVNGVAPGWTDTKLTAPAKANPDVYNFTIARTPLKRWGRPEELAGAVLFVASNDAASFINGITIPVDGGYQAV